MTTSPDAAEAEETSELPAGLCEGPCTATLRKTGKGIHRYGDPVLCSRCVSQLRSELLAIDTMAAVLAAGADGHRSSTGSDAAIRAHRSAGSRPSASPDHDLIDELISVLRKYVIMKRKIADRLGQVGRDVSELACWLHANADKYIYDREVAGELTDVVHRWYVRLEKRTKSGTALLHKPLPCPSCRKRGLEQERGSQVVKCRECGLIRSIDDYEAMAAEAADATDLATQAPAPAKTRRSETAA